MPNTWKLSQRYRFHKLAVFRSLRYRHVAPRTNKSRGRKFPANSTNVTCNVCETDRFLPQISRTRCFRSLRCFQTSFYLCPPNFRGKNLWVMLFALLNCPFVRQIAIQLQREREFVGNETFCRRTHVWSQVDKFCAFRGKSLILGRIRDLG